MGWVQGMNEAVNYIEEHIHVKVIDVALKYGYDSTPPLAEHFR